MKLLPMWILSKFGLGKKLTEKVDDISGWRDGNMVFILIR